MGKRVIHWFRKDLRLTDNRALHAAAADGATVIPVYVLSAWRREHRWTGAKRQRFLCESLGSLSRNLEAMGSRLILRAGEAVRELERLAAETGAEAVYFNRDYDPYGRETEQRLAAMCARAGIACHGYKDRVLHEPGEVLTGSGADYRVYTPYSRNWLAKPKDAPQGKPKSLGALPPGLESLPVPTVAHWGLEEPVEASLPEGGERAARARMREFLESGLARRYARTRNTPAGVTTSRLGQDLRFGLISIRELFERCLEAAREGGAEARASVETYIKELAWREFYLAVLWHHPEVFEMEFNPEFRGLHWPGTEEHFEAWCEGRTGFPIVDAGIRELLATGFMHNRVRMIVSMFLTKDLHCDWRWGESFFMRHLVDGENASNNGGWQWSAGTGADAAPYFRIQNPWTQTKTYDPEGAYIRRWVPELAKVDASRFTAPPPPGRPLAPGYPLPVVDHARERARTLELFKRHREGSR